MTCDINTGIFRKEGITGWDGTKNLICQKCGRTKPLTRFPKSVPEISPCLPAKECPQGISRQPSRCFEGEGSENTGRGHCTGKKRQTARDRNVRRTCGEVRLPAILIDLARRDSLPILHQTEPLPFMMLNSLPGDRPPKTWRRSLRVDLSAWQTLPETLNSAARSAFGGRLVSGNPMEISLWKEKYPFGEILWPCKVSAHSLYGSCGARNRYSSPAP